MLCYCKKDFYSKFDNNKRLFEKGKLYNIRYENDVISGVNSTVWVIYNKNGNITSSGCRFHTIKNKKNIASLANFYHFFMSERTSKLKIIESL